jgi:hypothetical protein
MYFILTITLVFTYLVVPQGHYLLMYLLHNTHLDSFATYSPLIPITYIGKLPSLGEVERRIVFWGCLLIIIGNHLIILGTWCHTLETWWKTPKIPPKKSQTPPPQPHKKRKNWVHVGACWALLLAMWKFYSKNSSSPFLASANRYPFLRGE